MKILLVHPEYPVTFWSFKHALRFIAKKAAYPPLGLLTVAGLLPEEWDLKLVDTNVSSLREGDLKWADYVMISAMLVQKPSAASILEQCRRAGVKVIAGGPLFSGHAEELSAFVDHLFLGEAEETMPLFLEDLAQGRPRAVYRAEGFPDLDKTPLPRWDLLDISKYATLMLQCSRGCPFNCDFCDITNLFGRKPRVKTADSLLAELQSIYDLGWHGTIFFVDDNFIGNKAKIKQILPRLIEWQQERGFPYSFLTEASINLADDEELIELMVEAGFDTVFIGLETPNEDSLRECEKNQNLKGDLVSSINRLQSRGLQVLGGYIVGFDNDDESIFANQIKFIQESGVVTAMVGLLNALPNTKLWQRLHRERRLLEDSSSGDNCDGSINFIPRMDREKLVEGYRQVVNTIYSPRQYYVRVSNFLEKYQPRRRKKLTWREFRAFVRSIFVLGVWGDGRSQYYYWKMLVKSFLFYRSKFSEAMTLMIYGHHFRKVARQMERRFKRRRVSSGEPRRLTMLV